MRCCICHSEARRVERVEVRSNVRRFARERFGVWQCEACRSIHACDEMDLAYYYADYPFHKLGASDMAWMLRLMYGNLVRRLRASGVHTGAEVLDYGCGSGHFLSVLRRSGFDRATGYDEFSPEYSDKRALDRTYDCVVTQDLIEHVADPLALVRELHRLTRPGGFISIGTPNAESVDLASPEDGIHSLHQPYHRHVLSKTALCRLGSDLGWELVRCYPTMYSNTLIPFLNAAFVAFYFRAYDNNLDLAIEPPKLKSWKLWTPLSLFLGLFGYFFPPRSDVMAVFRRQ